MTETLFQLTNEQRKYLGLNPVEKEWDLVKLSDMYLYFDGDIIRKKITVTEKSYHEQELDENTSDNRSILLPKTVKGKPKKMNFSATQFFSPFGVYFTFNDGDITIANFSTQRSYFSDNIGADKSIDDLKKWIDKWIGETTDQDLIDINSFKISKRQHQKFKEGDFFTFKIGRRKWGYGRILINVAKLKKTKEFKEQKKSGLVNLMGKALIVKVYHKISDMQCIDLDDLRKQMALPPQAIMDNHFYYGENEIIGHRELSSDEYDEPLISYNQSIVYGSDEVYLQYGLIYKDTSPSKMRKYLEKGFRNEGIGFNLTINNLEQCIAQKSNLPFWNTGYNFVETDLRNPKNIEIKREIFQFFGLDADKSYEENLKLFK